MNSMFFCFFVSYPGVGIVCGVASILRPSFCYNLTSTFDDGFASFIVRYSFFFLIFRDFLRVWNRDKEISEYFFDLLLKSSDLQQHIISTYFHLL